MATPNPVIVINKDEQGQDETLSTRSSLILPILRILLESNGQKTYLLGNIDHKGSNDEQQKNLNEDSQGSVILDEAAQNFDGGFHGSIRWSLGYGNQDKQEGLLGRRD